MEETRAVDQKPGKRRKIGAGPWHRIALSFFLLGLMAVPALAKPSGCKVAQPFPPKGNYLVLLNLY